LILGQLATGCPMVLVGLLSESPPWFIGGGFLGSWFWIRPSLAAHNKPKAKPRLGSGWLVAGPRLRPALGRLPETVPGATHALAAAN
jgi:hypothetical protein